MNPNTGVIKISRREIGFRSLKEFRHTLIGKSPEAEWNLDFGWAYKGIYPQKKLTFNQLDFLRHNMPSAHAAIEFLKSRMVSFNYRIKKKNGRHNNLSEKRAEKVNKVLQGPNQYGHTFRQIMMMWIDHLLCYDVGAMEKAVGILGGVDQIGPMDTRFLRPNVANDTGILNPLEAYYEVAYDDIERVINTYRADQILWGNLNPQAKSFYGFSPLEVLNTIITISIYADQHNMKVVSPASEKGGGIVWLGDIQPEIRKEFESRYDQFRKNDPGRPVFTGGGAEPKYLSLDDLRPFDWEKLQYRLSEIVVSVYGLQLRDVGIQSQHGSAGTAEIEDAITLKSAIFPRMLILGDMLNVGIVQPTGGDDLELEFIMKQEEPLETRTRAASMAVGRGALTLNEMRGMIDETLDKYPQEIGDKPFIIAGNQVMQLEDIFRQGGIPGQNPMNNQTQIAPVPDANGNQQKPGQGGNFHRTTQPQNDRGNNQNWQ